MTLVRVVGKGKQAATWLLQGITGKGWARA